MKRLIFTLLLFIIAGYYSAYAQPQYQMILTVTDPLPSIDFGGFAIGNGITGAPTLFRVTIITTSNLPVRLQGSLDWKDIGATNAEPLVRSFITKPFLQRTITNNDLGNAIQIDGSVDFDEELVNRNLRKGKPSGDYTLRLNLIPALATTPVLATEQYTLSFTNPTQTLAMVFPIQGVSLDPGNTIAVWNPITGASHYLVRAAKRLTPNQSFEDALRSGNPYINNKRVDGTTANLRLLLDREWSPGDEIVVQVIAVVQGIGEDYLYATPISFFLVQQLNAQSIATINTITTIAQPFLSQLNPALVQSLMSGQVTITGFQTGDGQILSATDVQNVLNYLSAHPNEVLNIIFRQN